MGISNFSFMSNIHPNTKIALAALGGGLAGTVGGNLLSSIYASQKAPSEATQRLKAMQDTTKDLARQYLEGGRKQEDGDLWAHGQMQTNKEYQNIVNQYGLPKTQGALTIAGAVGGGLLAKKYFN